MENKTNTMPEIWRTILVDQKNLHHYDWEENSKGHYLIKVRDYSDLENIKTVRTIRCKYVSQPCHWSWLKR